MHIRIHIFFFLCSYIFCRALTAGLVPAQLPISVSAYGEIELSTEVTSADETMALPDYNSWLSHWNAVSAASTGYPALTPGNTPADLNFAWYSVDAGIPAVKISTENSMENAREFQGTSTAIQRSNGFITYYSANHVSVTNYFTPGTTYYYSYADDITEPQVKWSTPQPYTPRDTGAFSVILTADPQIGASTSIPADTYSWNHTLEKAAEISPEAAFVLTAGDQIDFKKETDDANLRESEYAGLLYPPLLRSLPIAAVIGNHDTRVGDFQYHFNNPHSSGNYGVTPAGSDYYFRYGDALFIVLNSNSRDATSHREIMAQAVAENANAKWRIVSFHHDVYGSGAAHSNRTSANMRILFAPLMDEFNIDLVISGHDHSYARSFSMLDGTAIDYGDKNTYLSNPIGTTYLSLGTATGCKMFSLANPCQFYVCERSNQPIPTFSVLEVAGDTLAVKNYDYSGEKYADDFTIFKNTKKLNPLTAIEKAEAKNKKNYTVSSFNRLQKALKNFRKIFSPTGEDLGAIEVEENFFLSGDPLTYYGYAYGTTDALGDGFSTLLDKTRISCIRLSPYQLSAAQGKVTAASSQLVKTSLTVKKGKKSLKNKATIKLEKGKKLKLKVSASPSKYKVSYSSAAKKYVTVSKKGVIKAKKITPKKGKRKTVLITIKFQNRTHQLKVRVTKPGKGKRK